MSSGLVVVSGRRRCGRIGRIGGAVTVASAVGVELSGERRRRRGARRETGREAAKAVEGFLHLSDDVLLELLLEQVVEEGEHPRVLLDSRIVAERLTNITPYTNSSDCILVQIQRYCGNELVIAMGSSFIVIGNSSICIYTLYVYR